MSYASLAQVKEYLNIPTATTGDDALLTRLLATAQAIIDTHTARTFEATSDTTRTFDAVADVDGLTLWLDRDDLAQITSVVNGDGATITSNQYTTLPRNATPYHSLKLLSSTGISWKYEDDPEGAIVITGRWAYSVTAPADMTHAAIRIASWLYRQKDSSADLDRHIISSDGIALAPSRLPNDIVALIEPYRRRV